MFTIAFTPKVTRSACALSIPQPVRAGALMMGLLFGFLILYAAGKGSTIEIVPPMVRQYGAADSTIVVSPNPASEYITATPGADVIISRFHILNSSGSPIFSMNVSGAETVDVDLEAGNYYFLFETSLGMINKPMVIQ